jgi:hypothetical protein
LHKRKPGRDGPVQFAGVGAPTITFQRGTAACIMVAIWEDGATESPRSHRDYASAVPAAQRKASHVSHAKTGNIFALFTHAVEERRTLCAAKTA